MQIKECFNNSEYVQKYANSAGARLDYTRSMVNDIKIELKSCAIKEPLNILDIGCGTGDLDICLKEEFTDAKIFSRDCSEEMIEYAAKLNNDPNIEYINSNIEDYDGENQFFDLIVSQYSFELWDHSKALPNIFRMLKHGGMLYLRILNPEIEDKILDDFIQKYCSDEAEKEDFSKTVKSCISSDKCKKIIEKYTDDEVLILFFRSNSKYNSMEMRDFMKGKTINYNAVVKRSL